MLGSSSTIRMFALALGASVMTASPLSRVTKVLRREGLFQVVLASPNLPAFTILSRE